MAKKYAKPIRMRGHHLRILYHYASFYKNPNEDLLTRLHDSTIYTAVIDRHSRKHGVNIVETIEKALKQGTKIQLIDTLDDICLTCNNKYKKECKEFIPYGVSATADDRGTLYFYNLKKRIYTSELIIKRLLEKGRDL